MKIQMKVTSAEIWGGNGNITEHIRLSTQDGEIFFDGPGAHSVSLSFPDGEGFTNFPVGKVFDVTFTPAKEQE